MAFYPGKVGIFGGSFNPIHNGHLLCAERALQQLKLDFVLFLPNVCSPHKTPGEYASTKDRRALIEKAIWSNENFLGVFAEIESEEPKYTVDTLDRLKDSFAQPPYWLCGEDSWSGINIWKNPERMADLVAGVGVFTEDVRRLHEPSWAKGKVQQVSVPRIDIRATDIRNRIKQGRSIRYMVPDEVMEMIESRGLYK